MFNSQTEMLIEIGKLGRALNDVLVIADKTELPELRAWEAEHADVLYSFRHPCIVLKD